LEKNSTKICLQPPPSPRISIDRILMRRLAEPMVTNTKRSIHTLRHDIANVLMSGFRTEGHTYLLHAAYLRKIGLVKGVHYHILAHQLLFVIQALVTHIVCFTMADHVLCGLSRPGLNGLRVVRVETKDDRTTVCVPATLALRYVHIGNITDAPQEENVGYQLSSEDTERLSCAICLQLLSSPQGLPCQHSFCAACIAKLERKACPVCRSRFETSSPTHFIKAEIEDRVAIKCTKGCHWEGNGMNAFNKHRSVCAVHVLEQNHAKHLRKVGLVLLAYDKRAIKAETELQAVKVKLQHKNDCVLVAKAQIDEAAKSLTEIANGTGSHDSAASSSSQKRACSIDESDESSKAARS